MLEDDEEEDVGSVKFDTLGSKLGTWQRTTDRNL